MDISDDAEVDEGGGDGRIVDDECGGLIGWNQVD